MLASDTKLVKKMIIIYNINSKTGYARESFLDVSKLHRLTDHLMLAIVGDGSSPANSRNNSNKYQNSFESPLK